MYLVREKGGRGWRSVEREYKLTKIKAAIKLCQNMDPSMRAVQQFEERAVEKGHTSLMKEAHKFAEELGMSLSLEYHQPSCWSVSDPETEIQGPKVKEHLKNADMETLKEKIKEEKWHGRFLRARWQYSELNQSGCVIGPVLFPIPSLGKWSCTSSLRPLRCTQSTKQVQNRATSRVDCVENLLRRLRMC